MKIRPLFFRLFIALLVLFPGFAARAAVTYSVLTKFGASANGAEPNPLVQAGDGNFYGTNASGGANNCGTIFQLTSQGVLTTLYSFTGGNDGETPLGALVVGSDGALYGTTTAGGSAANGTFFKITTTGTFTLLHTFNGTSEGAAPDFIYPGGDGNFYGASLNGGGGNEGGTFLQFTTAGVVTVLHAFQVEATDGGFVNPFLVQGNDGAFYGTTQEGGPSGFGTIFRITTAGSFSVIANLASFSDAPFLETLGSDGNIYGVNSRSHSIFSMTNTGARTTFYTFTGTGSAYGAQALIHGADGNFYGISTGDGANGYGTFFEITIPGNTFAVIHPFTKAEVGVDTLIQAADGSFYATSTNSGPGTGGSVFHLTSDGNSTDLVDFSHGGTAPLGGLLEGLDGNLYGTTSLGGDTGDGTVFGMSTAGELLSTGSFDFATTGSLPTGPVVQDPATGTLYTTATTGGPNYSNTNNLGGTLAAITIPPPSGGSQAIARSQAIHTGRDLGLHNIETLDFVLLLKYNPKTPYKSYYLLIGMTELDIPPSALDSYFFPTGGGQHPSGITRTQMTSQSPTSTSSPFGVSEFGGDNNTGTLYAVDPAGQQIDGFLSFGNQAGDGSNPEAAPIADSAGNLYGTTAFGGAGGFGTIYKVTPANGTTPVKMTTLHPFSGTATDGASPGSNNLVLGKNGLIYGTTKAGGAHGGGVVFSISPTGTFNVLHSFQAQTSSGTDGSMPMAGLIQASDGNFYGTTIAGGTRGVGTVFSMTPSGTVTIIHNFADGVANDGAQPQAKLVQAADGNLYGVTPSGGGSGTPGVLFKIAAGLPSPKGTTAQTITFPALASQVYGAGPINLGATASSGLSVTYTVTGPATVLGGVLTITGVGTVKVTANQPGNDIFAAATPVSQSFTVAKATQAITFPAIAAQTFGEAPFTLSNPPTASSGLPVTVTLVSGPATVSAGKITLTGAGTVTLAANQIGNANFAAAPMVTTSFSVGKASQTIAPFATIPTHNNGDPAFTITVPKASSGLPVVVTVQSGPAKITGSSVTVTGIGPVVLAADQPGNANYNAAPEITTTFNVLATKQTIAAFTAIPTKTLGVAPFTITPPKASSGLPVTVTVLSGNASISGNTVTLTGDGPVVLAANQAGNANFAPAAQVTTTFLVNGQAQTISPFATIPAQTFGGMVTITPPTASSGLAVTVTVKSGPAMISGNTVTLTGVGTVVLAADQPGDSTYAPAKEVTTSFTVAKASQTIAAWGVGNQSYSITPFAITPPTATSGLPVTVTVKSGPAKISGNMVTTTGLGTVVLSAAQAGNANYSAAAPVTASFTITQGGQNIITFAVPDQIFSTTPFTPTATASSGLPVTITVASGPATISAGKLTLTGVGTVTLAGNQAGNTDFSAAALAFTSFVVSPATQSIAPLATIPAKAYSTTPFTVTIPAATSKLPTTLSVLSGPATVVDNKVTLTGAGYVVLAADQPGNANYLPAGEVTTSFLVTPVAQTISSFAPIPTKNYGVAPFAIVAPTATSGLPVTVTVLSGNATISNNVVTLTGYGPVILAANQPGNAGIGAAPQVTTTFQVNGLPQTLVLNTIPPQTASASGSPLHVTLSATNSINNTVTYTATSTAGVVNTAGNTLTVNVAGLPPGKTFTITITGSSPGDATHAPTKSSTTFTVTVTA